MCKHYEIGDEETVLEFSFDFAAISKESRKLIKERRRDRKQTVQAWPKAEMPIVVQGEAGRTIESLRWGVWPYYEKTKPRVFVDNARNDSLLSKRIWKDAVQVGRCLIPADGFYEYAGPAGAKWEVRFRLSEQRPFFFAGLWAPDPDGLGAGFTMVTCEPNEMLAALPHDRMPVILPDNLAADWLGNMPQPEEKILALCRPYDTALMTREDMPRQSRKTNAAPTVADATQSEML